MLLFLYNNIGDIMNRKEQAIDLIKKTLNNETFLTYKEIAQITNYHPKYLLKLKKEIINNQISLEHGNKNKIPANKMSEEEKNKIISLYKRSHASVRKFVKFYGTRSYSCIYKILKEAGLI